MSQKYKYTIEELKEQLKEALEEPDFWEAYYIQKEIDELREIKNVPELKS